MNAVLIVALHFPPFTTGSGYQRTLAFTRGLPARGWRPLVLTATQSAFRARQMRGGEAPPEQVEVILLKV